MKSNDERVRIPKQLPGDETDYLMSGINGRILKRSIKQLESNKAIVFESLNDFNPENDPK